MARIRSSPRRRSADRVPPVAAQDIDFPHFWRQLSAVGWTSKRPTGLGNDWSYTSPDRTKVFVGVEELVTYAVETGLLDTTEPRASSDDEAEVNDRDEDASVEDERVEDSEGVEDAAFEDNVRASQIDTTAQLSQHTLNELFGSSSESEVELSQQAVAHAFGLSPSDSHREAAVSLQLLSEASGADTEPEEDIAPARSLGPVLRPRAPTKKDINFVPPDEDMGAYESLSSGESDDGDFDEDDEDGEGSVRDGQDVDEEVLSEDDAAEMDEAFVASLQVGDSALDKEATKQRESALRSMQWTPESSQFEESGASYPGMEFEEASPVPELRALAESPLRTFFYFLPKSLWVTISAETNRYSLQQVDRRAQAILEKFGGRRKKEQTLTQIRRRLKAASGYETHEILHVIGLLIARMLCPQKRRFAAHWSMVEDGAVPAGTFGRFMGRNRCQDILRDLHFVDNESEPTRDKLWKLRPVVDKLQQRFLSGWTLPSVFSFDEGVLPSTSKRNTTRMYMPDKPHRYGSKMYMVCDSRSAYCHRFEMYVGKRDASGSGKASFDHNAGAGAVVRNLQALFRVLRLGDRGT